MTDELKALSDAATSGKWVGNQTLHLGDMPSEEKWEIYSANRDFACALANAYCAGELVPATAIEAARAEAVAECEKWLSNAHITLHAGEMTAQELRSVKAVVGAIARAIRAGGEHD